MSSDIELLAVMSLDKADRARCQAPGCKHYIYARVHVVRESGAISFYGSECFKKRVGKYTQKPHYGDWGDKVLTPAEKEELMKNTERLLEYLQERYNTERNKAIPEAKPVPQPLKSPTPSQTGYGGSRTLKCIGCGNTFVSSARWCPTCCSGENVFTFSS